MSHLNLSCYKVVATNVIRGSVLQKVLLSENTILKAKRNTILINSTIEPHKLLIDVY